MRTEVVNKEDVKQAPVFPALYMGKEQGHVVLFRNPTCGTVLVKGTQNYNVGTYYECWGDCTKSYAWNRLSIDSHVILQNDK